MALIVRGQIVVGPNRVLASSALDAELYDNFVWHHFAMSANGIFRELVLKRVFSSTTADILSDAMGVVFIALLTRFGFRPLTSTNSTTSLLLVSMTLVLLTIVFETALGRLVDHKSWNEIAAHYALWRGELWLLVLGFLAITPFLWARWWPQTAS